MSCRVVEKAGQELAAELQGVGAEAIFIHTDVLNENEVRDLVDQAIARFGHPDVAVNCAGTEGKPGPVTLKLEGLFRHSLSSTC